MLYNENVHLVHARSGYFLDTFSETAEHHSFSVQLCAQVSHSSVFRLLPLYNIKSTSEKVQINDRFRIKNVKTGYYLNFTSYKGYQSFTDINASQGIQKEKSDYEFSHPNDELNTCAVILTETGIVWNSKLARKFGCAESKHVVSHSLVRVKFPHFEAEMCADLCYLVGAADEGDKDEGEEVYSKKYFGDHSEENNVIRSLWMVQTSTFECTRPSPRFGAQDRRVRRQRVLPPALPDAEDAGLRRRQPDPLPDGPLDAPAPALRLADRQRRSLRPRRLLVPPAELQYSPLTRKKQSRDWGRQAAAERKPQAAA